MSAQVERSEPARFACSNKLGWVGGASAYPVTLAPSASSHNDIQLPLKPVCPVRKIFRPRQNERLSMVSLYLAAVCEHNVPPECRGGGERAEAPAEQHNLIRSLRQALAAAMTHAVLASEPAI